MYSWEGPKNPILLTEDSELRVWTRASSGDCKERRSLRSYTLTSPSVEPVARTPGLAGLNLTWVMSSLCASSMLHRNDCARQS